MPSVHTFKFLGLATLLALSGSFSVYGLTSEVAPESLLKRMSDEIASLDHFIVRGEVYADARLPAGQIIQNASDVTLRIRRPDAMRLTLRTIDGAKELYFSNSVLTLYSEVEKFYAQADIVGDIDAAADFAVNKVGIDAPMLDLLSNNVATQLQQDAEKVQYIGQDMIRGSKHDHVAIRMPEVDVQIWIAATGKSLPGKMVISSKWEGGSPRTVVFFNWQTEPDFPSGTLKFETPSDASEVDFLLEHSE
jgi:hypothetical protein